METSFRGTPVEARVDYLEGVQRKLAAGQEMGGVLWIGCPAQTEIGARRERSCTHSEAAAFGSDWLDLSRCLKQILYSCDGCFRYLDKPFYEQVRG